MALFTRNDLKILIKKQRGWCISIFMPAHRAKPETLQDPIRFKNLLRQAEKQLKAAGLRASGIKELLSPAQKLLDSDLFWQYQSDGLAVFISSGIFKYYRLPFRFKKLVLVSDRFHTKPLLQFLSADGRFYILAFSQNRVRLLQGSQDGASEIELRGVPKGIADILKYYDAEKQLQLHTGTPGRPGKRAAIFHGHGGGKEEVKKNLLLYFQQVDKGLHGIFGEEQAPLVLAGVDYLIPIYKRANTYPHLMEQIIVGNPDNLNAEELHERAWSIVKPLFFQEQEKAVSRYLELTGTGRASHDLKSIIPAAHQGRIETLFLAVGIQKWGLFDPDANSILFHRYAKPGDGDLLDLAAIQTILNGGKVYAVDPKRVPGGTSAAAVFRY
jgi:hypothetical protein